MNTDSLKFKFSIDRGGTFTDIYCEVVENGVAQLPIVTKLLSEDPSNYKDAPTEGIRRILEEVTGIPHPRNSPVNTSCIEYIRMGTTVATNALLERKGMRCFIACFVDVISYHVGERCALITTKGFGDLQIIGNQSRPKIFDLEIKRPDLLYEYVAEIDERVVLVRDDSEDTNNKPSVLGLAHDKLVVEKAIDDADIRRELLHIQSMGIRSVAVVFLHSYTFTQHELRVKHIAEEMGFEQISLSSEVMPMVRVVPRGCTTCVDAYLTPIIKRYLKSFCSGFDENLVNGGVQVGFMQSDGGLTPMNSFLGNRAILSGPAGGVVGYARTSYDRELAKDPGSTPMPVIGFDMGGTSTDVSRYAGVFEHVFESTTAGVTIQSPQLDINTVAAGGGSRLFYRNGLFVVGPESAGAHPGPVCYRKNGPLTVTDANVLLGRVQPHLFPAIFGPHENECLDLDATRQAFEHMRVEISASNGKQYSIDEIAYGFIRVANEAMARPIRNLTTMKGYDVTKHALSCFGGAGPQHCCAIAKSLGMKKIYVHRYSGILSAYGLSLADVVVEKQQPFCGMLSVDNMAVLNDELTHLYTSASEELSMQGFDARRMSTTLYLNCRYEGTDTAIMTNIPHTTDVTGCSQGHNLTTQQLVDAYLATFVATYQREYGFELTGRVILVDDVRVRAIGVCQKEIGDASTEVCRVHVCVCWLLYVSFSHMSLCHLTFVISDVWR